MSMIDSFKFIARCRNDTQFRGQLYEFDEPTGFRSFLHDAGYIFTDAEFDDSIASLKLRAIDEYEAEEIHELGQWYAVLARPATASSCTGCSGKCH